ncbi:MAG TPA: SIMPL domain-containing protein [Candidatus Paceibacterota bacterium]|nr:SIMPL domain-containing protein [Candidatus Paceibacterota bacterium]
MEMFNRPAFRNLAYALLALLVAFTAAKLVSELKSMKYIGTGIASADTITVSGEGDVIAPPDIATFTFTVQEEGPSVPDAQKKATDNMNAILAYLKKSGVEDRDVKTDSYNIYPRYEYHQTANMPYYGGGTQVLAAYVVSQTVEIKVRKLDQAGTLLSGIGEFGASNVSGLSFSVDNETQVERQARDKAIADAKEQAQSLAQSLGVSLVRIVSFNEANNRPMPIYYAKADAVMGMGGAESAPSLPTGENKITSNVTITYEIK